MGESAGPGNGNSWNQLLSLYPEVAREGYSQRVAVTGEGQPTGKELLSSRKDAVKKDSQALMNILDSS